MGGGREGGRERSVTADSSSAFNVSASGRGG